MATVSRSRPISPGVVDTGWAEEVTHDEGKQIAQSLDEGAIGPECVADVVVHTLDQPADVTVNDIVVHPTRQDC
ncbi:short-chain dehydrogenase [Streptomyces phaeochromogenes]|uniref:short-chain dehydrogenase n=1 Tax=Streptomyces phaeochromogenes TaxID=1923 RepID=UPI00367BCFA4